MLIQRQISAAKHTGFEDTSNYYNLLSLPSLAGFFFAYLGPLSEGDKLIKMIPGLIFYQPSFISTKINY